MDKRGWGSVVLGVLLGVTGPCASARAESSDTYDDATDGFAEPGVDTAGGETDVIGETAPWDVPPDETDTPWDVPPDETDVIGDPDVPPDDTDAPWDVPLDPDVPPAETGAPWDVPLDETWPGTWAETWDDGEVGPVDPVPTCDPGLSAQSCWDGVGWACGLQWCTSDGECGAGEACIQRLVQDEFPTCTSGQQGSIIMPCDDASSGDKMPPRDPSEPFPATGACFPAKVCGNPADSLCAPGLVAQDCGAGEPVQCGLVQCFGEGSCSFGELCRARYARVMDVPCAGGWSTSVTVPCTLGEPDCASVAVCVPDPSPSPSDVDPEASPEGMPDTMSGTTSGTTSGTGSAEAISGRFGDDMSGCASGRSGLAWLLGAGLALLLWARRGARSSVGAILPIAALAALVAAAPGSARAVPAAADTSAASADVGFPTTPPPECDPGLSAQYCGRDWVCATQVCFSDAECTGGRVCLEQPTTTVTNTCPDGSVRSLSARCDAANLGGCYPAGICSQPEERICDDAKALRVCGNELRCALRPCTDDFSCMGGEVCRARYVRSDTWTCDGSAVQVLATCTLGDSGCDAGQVCVLDTTEPGPDVDAAGVPDARPEFTTGTGTGTAEVADGIAGEAAAECGAAPGWFDPALWGLAVLVLLGRRRFGGPHRPDWGGQR